MRMIIMEPCFVPDTVNGGAPIPLANGDMPNLEREQAIALANIGRALYVESRDDHTKGAKTAPQSLVDAAIAAQREAEAEALKKAGA